MAVNTQGFGIQLATGGFSLEANTIFTSYAAALVYAKSSAAYVGKVISVTEGTEKGVYVIEAIGSNAILKKVGSDINLDNYVTKDQLTNIYTYKGSKTTYEDLPTEGNVIGDVWNVEEAYKSTLDNKEYPAGTNYVWNGETWDAQGGSIDLSGYATKLELQSSVETLTQSVADNLAAIGLLQTSVNNKVEKVEGSSLISSEKLALIDTNAAHILTLENQNLDQRISTLEGMFKDGDNNIDLSGISESITNHANRISALETDNAQSKLDIAALQTSNSDIQKSIEDIVELNVQQTGQITGLTTELSNIKTSVQTNTNEIAQLAIAIGNNTTEISNIKDSISGLAIKSVASSEKVIAADENGVLSTTLGLDSYVKEVNGVSKTYVKLTGIEGAIISEFDASAFVKDGMINSVTYDVDSKTMSIAWNTDSGIDKVEIPLSGLVDTYTADNKGLVVENNQFSIKLNPAENNLLTVDNNGLMVDLTDTVESLEATMDNKINEAFAWIDIN